MSEYLSLYQEVRILLKVDQGSINTNALMSLISVPDR